MTPAARLLIHLIERYQRAGGGARLLVDCNFEPTCSEYARQAIHRHGAWKGGRLAWGRLCRCNDRDAPGRRPDPVP